MRVWNKNELDKLIFVLYKMANIELSNEWLINVFSGKFEDIFKFEMVQIKMSTLYFRSLLKFVSGFLLKTHKHHRCYKCCDH